MILQKLYEREVLNCPKFLLNNTCLLAITGSEAYGCSSGGSDIDIQGIAIPPLDDLFPHLRGEIQGFGTHLERFETFQQHHILDNKSGGSGNEYDITIYSIVKFFQLCMEMNPNIIDVLFSPSRCVLHSTGIGNIIRDNRKIFLHKGCWTRFKNYSFSQMKKMKTQESENEKRKNDIATYGYSLKNGYNVVRLLNECEQILIEHDLDLERNREQLKSIRRGEWTLDRIETYHADKSKYLEEVYANSTLAVGPDENKIKDLLIRCIEEHYGRISADTLVKIGEADRKLQEIKKILEA